MKCVSGKEIGNIFDRFDLFAKKPDSYTLEGYRKIGTPIGFILTLIFGFFMTLFTMN
jgi:hypothetical protein